MIVKLVGLMTVRNEEWVLGLSLRAALLFVDEMVVLDHASNDGTADLLDRIAAEHPGRVHHLRENDLVWREVAIRQRLLEAGRRLGATHLCVIDADEVLTGNLLPDIRERLAALSPGETLSLPWLALWQDLDAYRDDEGYLAGRRMIFGFRDAPGLHYAPNGSELDFHTRRIRGAVGDLTFGTRHDGGVLHLSAVNWRRLLAKVDWYRMTEAVRFPTHRSAAERDAMYASCYLDETGVRTRPVPPHWWTPYQPWRDAVVLDGGAWYEAECRRMWREHGADRFSGIELLALTMAETPNQRLHRRETVPEERRQ
jgi:glycosyltransferase involved in cell wall biosynthesis